jgi:hypothetical protein
MDKKFRRVIPENIKVEKLTPLDITCGATKCNEGYHCFSLKSSLKEFSTNRVCKECGADLIDWERVYKNNIHDAPFIFESLKKELIRHVVWHTEIKQAAITKTLQKGRTKIREHAYHVLKSKIGRYNNFDGRQTSLTGDDIVNYAQHATATCCRRCMEAWHNIPKNIELDETQLEFCTELVMLYINDKVPNLSDDGISKKE